MVFIGFEHLVEYGVVAARVVEDENGEGNDEKNGSHLTDSQGVVIQHILRKAVVSGLDGRHRAFQCGVVGAWYKQAEAGNTEETGANLADTGVELLRLLPKTADEEACAETEEQIRENGAQDRGLDDWYQISVLRAPILGFVLCDQDEEEDDLHDGTEGRFNENAGDLGHLARIFLPCLGDVRLILGSTRSFFHNLSRRQRKCFVL